MNINDFIKCLHKHVPPCEAFQCPLKNCCSTYSLACEAYAEFVDDNPLRAPDLEKETPTRIIYREIFTLDD